MTSFDLCFLPYRAKWKAYSDQQLLRAGQPPDLGYWEAYAQKVMGPQIAAFRPAVYEADPAGVFRQQYLDSLLGIERA